MIESPPSVALVEAIVATPPYTDAETEKDLLASGDLETKEVDVTILTTKRITTSVRGTVRHLYRTGGVISLWRGAGYSVLYECLLMGITHFLIEFLNLGRTGGAFVFIFVSLALVRVHMLWTIHMIAAPSKKAWYKRLPARRECKPLLLPTLMYAAANQLLFFAPVELAELFGLTGPGGHEARTQMIESGCPKQMLKYALAFMVVPLTYGLVYLFAVFPAQVALIRVEAALMPEGEETIVPFDKAAVVGELDLSVRGSSRALYIQAWSTFDRASSIRVLKLYFKSLVAQLMVVLVAMHALVAELSVFGPEKWALAMRSGLAQVQLMALEVDQD